MTVSNTMRAALNRTESDDEIVCLLTITHPNLTEDIRVTASPVTKFDEEIYGIDSRGDRFIYLPFDFTIPDQVDGVAPTVQLKIENVSREITLAFKAMTSPAVAKVELVLAKYPDVVEVVWDELYLRRGQGDVIYVTADVTADDVTSERYPADGYTPSLYPGVF